MRRWALLLVLLGSVLALALVAAIGSGDARFAAGVGLLAIALPAAVGVAKQAGEHEPEARPGPAALFVESLAGPAGPVVVGTAALLALIVTAGYAPASGPRHEAGWVEPAVATVAAAALVYALGASAARTVRREGPDREQLLRCTSVAFFVTVIGAGAYALFEAFADAPRISMWNVWSLGCGSWFVVTLVDARLRRSRQ